MWNVCYSVGHRVTRLPLIWYIKSILSRRDKFWLVQEREKSNTSTLLTNSCYLILSISLWKRNREKAMAPPSSTLAWKIPWMEKPGRLQSMGSLGVGYDWVTSLSLFTFMHWRRKWQPTPLFLPGEPQRQGSLVGCHLWGRTESDMTEVT